MVKNIVNNILKKITDKFSVKKEKFEATATAGKPPNFFVILVIVSFICDILKLTPVYNNNIMKNVLNTNHFLSYGIGSLLKIILIVYLFIPLLGESTDDLQMSKSKLAERPTTSKQDDILEDYNDSKSGIYMFSIICFILLSSFILDIFQFTPLMQNQYMNQIVTMNSHAQTVALMICKSFVIGSGFSSGLKLR
jgi:hypothetical protein